MTPVVLIFSLVPNQMPAISTPNKTNNECQYRTKAFFNQKPEIHLTLPPYKFLIILHLQSPHH